MKNAKPILGTVIFCLWAAIVCLSVKGQRVTQIAAGLDTSFFIKSDGSLWRTGGNYPNQVASQPVEIVTHSVVSVTAPDAVLFIKSDSSLWAMGVDWLGDGTVTTTYRSTPECILSNSVVAVGGGYAASFFIKSDGSLWGMGENGWGQLGDGTTEQRNSPEQIVPNGVVAVTGAYSHTLFLESDGSVWGMGYNGTAVYNGAGAISDTNADDIEFDSPVLVVSNGVMAIAAADWYSLFIKSDGSLWGMGYNGQGQLGDGTTTSHRSPVQIVSSNVVAVAAGDEEVGHSLFLKSDGSLWGMGYNGQGELGDGSKINRSTPVPIVSSGVIAVATGAWDSYFLKSDGSLWGMGWNSYGELGDGTTIERDTPVLIVPPPPVILNLSVAGSDLIFQGTNGVANRDYSVLISTNLAPPSNEWRPIATNTLVTEGGFTITATNAFNLDMPQRFYTLRLNQ